MKLTFINTFEIDKKTNAQIKYLLQSCFPEAEYRQRTYYKQLSHYRILATENEQLVGQLGIDYRVMNLNGEAVKVLGVIDLCVSPSLQNKGIGTKLMQKFEAVAKRHSDNIDFLFFVLLSVYNVHNGQLLLHFSNKYKKMQKYLCQII